MMRFGDMLHGHRKHRGLTQQQLADLATLSVRAVRNLERGGALRPRRETVRLLVDVLRLDADQRAQFESAAFAEAPGGAPRDRGPGLRVPGARV
ncbi:helix-turn-helix domain-containing protein [Kitasatospora sp. NBC_01300]|uniref:helix-turn-helix domain-containing protein n=1 Tax=Kitasatospora sp. NBC_01300 TaxID=2903574 RepID=UPI00352FC553|nr:helix-turn-helix domain-containing protein [Kitasatospora sp. NBC_01300]